LKPTIDHAAHRLQRRSEARTTEIKPCEEFEHALAQCKPEDFDGHTEFHRLTPEQRLEWLCQAATFVYKFKGKANSGAGN
jgi:hypothetical protein